MVATDANKRFWAKVDKNGPYSGGESLGRCWRWTAYLSPSGYGRFSVPHSRSVLAYLWAYERLVGPVPQGFELDHLCRNRACVNPSHLEPVTHRVNMLRGIGPAATRAQQTHCKRGHELTDANIYRRPDRPTTRQCIACTRLHDRARYHDDAREQLTIHGRAK